MKKFNYEDWEFGVRENLFHITPKDKTESGARLDTDIVLNHIKRDQRVLREYSLIGLFQKFKAI